MARIAAWCLFLSLTSSASAETLKVLALSSNPFFYDDGGTPAGIEYDIVSHFAKSRGLELDVEYVDAFADLLTRVASGEAVVAAGTITITPERSRRVDFSIGYFPVQVVLVERSADASRSPSDLSGHEVAAFSETTAEDALRAVDGVSVVQRDGMTGMLEAVARGEIRGAAADSSAVIPIIGDWPTLAISLSFGEAQEFGFAFPKGSPYRDGMSDHILGLKESGIYYRILTAHMGPAASEIVRGARASKDE